MGISAVFEGEGGVPSKTPLLADSRGVWGGYEKCDIFGKIVNFR